MTKCQFYRTEMKVERANAHYPGAKEFAPRRVAVPYCIHTASITPKGSSKPLNCAGDLSKCLIAEKL
jgi:hypothetical protein